MSVVNLGRIKPLHRGDYDATASYGELDIVAYQGAGYLCVGATALQGTPPVDGAGGLNAGWQLLADKGAVGEVGPQGPPGRNRRAGAPRVPGPSVHKGRTGFSAARFRSTRRAN